MTVCTNKYEARIAQVLARFQDQTPLSADEAKEVVSVLEKDEQLDTFYRGDLALHLASAVSVQENLVGNAWMRSLPVRDASPEALRIFEDFTHRYGYQFNYAPAPTTGRRPDFIRRADASGNTRLSYLDIQIWQRTGQDPNPARARIEPAPAFRSRRPPRVNDGMGSMELVGFSEAPPSRPAASTDASGLEEDGWQPAYSHPDLTTLHDENPPSSPSSNIGGPFPPGDAEDPFARG